jgi:hypothetical protein
MAPVWIGLLLVYLAYRLVLYPLAQLLDWWTSRVTPKSLARYRESLNHRPPVPPRSRNRGRWQRFGEEQTRRR